MQQERQRINGSLRAVIDVRRLSLCRVDSCGTCEFNHIARLVVTQDLTAVGIWPESGPGHTLTIAAVACQLCVVVALIVRRIRPTSPAALLITTASPYVLILGVPGCILAVEAGAWAWAITGLLLTGRAVLTQAYLYRSIPTPEDSLEIVVMSSNLLLGEADPDSVVAAVRAARVDVLMLQELTGPKQKTLQLAGLNSLLPHQASRPLDGGAGTGLWSRYPLHDISYPSGLTFATVVAHLELPGLHTMPTLVALHLAGPVPDSTDWVRDIAALPQLLHTLEDGTTSVVVGGDFNATYDVSQFRDLLVGGYRDAAAQAGAGYLRTYPSNRWFPPLLALDHVLCRQAVATSARSLPIAGSDHRALLVRVALPARPDPPTAQ